MVLPSVRVGCYQERLGIRVEIHVRVVRQATQAGDVLALLVIRTAGQLRIVAVHLGEGQLVQEARLPRVEVSRQGIAADDADARPADGDVGQQGVRVAAHRLEAGGQLFRRDVVEVRQTQPRVAADVVLPFAPAEAHGHGKARARLFLPGGRLGQLLLQVVPVALRMAGHGFMAADHLDDGFQTHFGGDCVPVAFEQADGKVFHGNVCCWFHNVFN